MEPCGSCCWPACPFKRVRTSPLRLNCLPWVQPFLRLPDCQRKFLFCFFLVVDLSELWTSTLAVLPYLPPCFPSTVIQINEMRPSVVNIQYWEVFFETFQCARQYRQKDPFRSCPLDNNFCWVPQLVRSFALWQPAALQPVYHHLLCILMYPLGALNAVLVISHLMEKRPCVVLKWLTETQRCLFMCWCGGCCG